MASPLKRLVLLDRLCQFASDALQCDLSRALLWQSKENAYVPVSGSGDTPEQWESIRVLRVPAAGVADLLARLQRDDVVQVVSQDLPPGARAILSGVEQALCVPLREGAGIIGVLIAGYRERREPFTPPQEHIARSIAQLAAMAVERAPLVMQRERASNLKSEIVATASNELRTPLSVIMGYNDLLLDGAFGPITAEQTEILRRMDTSVQQSLDLIDTILDLSRVDTRRPPLEPREMRSPH